VLGHLARNNEVFLLLRRAVQEIGLRELSGECKGSQRVHNHVDPEELDGLQRRLLKQDGTDDGEDKGVDVDGQLELQETLDVVIDISSPLSSLDDGSETVIGDDDIGSSLAYISSSHTHAKTDISLGKGGSIIGTVTGDSDDLAHVSQTCD